MPGLAKQSKPSRHDSAFAQGDPSNSDPDLTHIPESLSPTTFAMEIHTRLERFSDRLKRLTTRVRNMTTRNDHFRAPSSVSAFGVPEIQSAQQDVKSGHERNEEGRKWKVSRWRLNPRKDDMMSGALPLETESLDAADGAGSTSIEARHPDEIPTRAMVIARIRHEESNTSLSLRDPDCVRVGSCSSFVISQMLMMCIDNDTVVLPNLGSIQKCEIRSLKAWLIDRDLLQKSETVSRTDKLLYCLQLLRSGNRYESIAVIFSQSPRQVKEGCLEVVEGLWKLFEFLADETCDHETDADNWGIWERFNRNREEATAQRYYGFSRSKVAKVLVALDLFLRLSRGASSRSFDGGASETDGASIRSGESAVPGTRHPEQS